MGNRLSLKLIKLFISIILLSIMILFSFYTLDQTEFTINVDYKDEILYSQRKYHGKIEKYKFYTLKNGEKKCVEVIRKDNGIRSSIVDIKKNNNDVIAFFVQSFYYTKTPSPSQGFSFKREYLPKVESYIIFSSSKNKIIAKKIHPNVSKIEWIDNKVLKLGTIKPFKNEYIKNPFSLTIYEKIIEGGKDFIKWFKYKFILRL